MQTIRRTLVWLSRINHCRGFGIQSPWAYRMDRNVINGRRYYPAYGTLRRRHPSLGSIDRRLCELCLRLADNTQPRVMLNIDSKAGISGDYLKAGCRTAKYVEVAGDADAGSLRRLIESNGGAGLIRIAPEGNFGKLFATACRQAAHGTVIMLLGIHTDSTARKLWNDTVKMLPRTVTFDLYYCGLIFFDDKRFKQNYIINF